MPVNSSIHYFEIVTDEVDATRDSYAAVYGWKFGPAVAEFGNAVVAELPEGARWGIRAPMHGQEKPTLRTYVRVSDVEASTMAAAESGAEVLLPPMEIPGHGRIAIYRIGGVEQGIWQLP